MDYDPDLCPLDEHAAAVDLLLSAGWKDDRGFMTPPGHLKSITAEEWEALEYLCDEWDYAMGPR